MKKQHLILGILALCGALLLVCVGAYLAYTTWQMRTEVAQALVEQEEQEKRGAYSASVRSLLRDTTQERALLKGMTQGRDAVDLIRELETLGAQLRITLKIDSVSEGGAVSQDPTLLGYTVSLRGEGSFANLLTFMRDMEYAPVPARIEQATLEHTKEGWVLSMRARFLVDVSSDPLREN